jgi:electron transport complex protein RnfB
MPRQITPEKIDAILPQTQCGLCGYGGCMPYAEALAFENAAINLCPPGGVKGLIEIGKLLKEDPSSFIPEMEQKAKPKLLAVIREQDCIGCTKCIQACPVDAILGSAKHMHTIITAECTGCELCVAPCPVDCIDLVAIPEKTAAEEKQIADVARQRFQQRQTRLAKNGVKEESASLPFQPDKSTAEKKSFIEEALLRAKLKKQAAQLRES